jgi:CubicO group peptidase (beta-lactamase class C family)
MQGDAFCDAVGVCAAGSDAAPHARTQSRICMTKSFTGAAMLILRDAGRIALDDPVSEYVPAVAGWAAPTDDSPPVTIRMLLSMSAGLPEDDGWADRCLDWPAEHLDELLGGGVTFATPAGTRFEYSNLGWVVLGRVVGRVTGMRVQDFVRAMLLVPLGLEDTTWQPASGSILTGHRLGRSGVTVDTPPLGDGAFAPMGGLWSTVRDLCRWVAFFLDAYPPRSGGDESILSRASRREMQSPSVPADPLLPERSHACGYGFGLFIEDDHRHGCVVAHPGGLPGYGSCMRWLPSRRVGVVALANLTYASLEASTMEVFDLLEELGVLPAPALEVSEALRALAERLVAMLNEWDAAREPEIFTPNVVLDVDRSERVRQARELRHRLGRLRLGEVESSGATRGTATAAGERGAVRLSLLLSPEAPPRIQSYEIDQPGRDLVQPPTRAGKKPRATFC